MNRLSIVATFAGGVAAAAGLSFGADKQCPCTISTHTIEDMSVVGSAGADMFLPCPTGEHMTGGSCYSQGPAVQGFPDTVDDGWVCVAEPAAEPYAVFISTVCLSYGSGP